MKKTLKIGVAILVIFVLTSAVCFGQTLNSAEELRTYLNNQPANTPNNPIRVSINANEQMFSSIKTVLIDSERYVTLTLSGNALKTIPNDAFNDNIRWKKCDNLVGIIIPNSVTSIGNKAFISTGLTSIIIPDSVTDIGTDAFQYCRSLTSVIIGSGVTSIKYGTFEACSSLTSVTIGSGVTSIGLGAFAGGRNLAAIYVDSANTAYSSQSGILYNKNKTLLHTYPAGKTETTFTIPSSVTSIEWSAFSGCRNLTSVTIPDSVTKMGGSIFWDCRSLTSVTISNRVTEIMASTFGYCTSLTSIIIPNSVKKIWWSAFLGCTSLTSVRFNGTIPANSFDVDVFGTTSDGSGYIRSDLRAKYLAGGIGTYTRQSGGEVWTKQL